MPTVVEVVGDYRGEYANAFEVFELRSDGSFVQELTIRDKPAYKHQGTWRLNRAQVVFDNFLMARDMYSDGSVGVPDRSTDNVRGLWIGDAIVFNIVVRVSKSMVAL